MDNKAKGFDVKGHTPYVWSTISGDSEPCTIQSIMKRKGFFSQNNIKDTKTVLIRDPAAQLNLFSR